MKKKLVAGLLTGAMMAALLTGCVGSGSDKSSDAKESYTIGIEQFAEHGSLDNCREGFLQGLEEEGIKDLEDKVKEMFLKGDISFNDQVYISNVRQKNALLEALESMKKVIRSIDDNMPEDFYSIDLMDAYESLGYITGNSVGEDLINEIFSKFCMGK